jgi:K+-transporting ATPase ATPase C chain
MFRELRASIILFIFFTFIGGLFYPTVVLGLGRILFPDQSNGSLIEANNQVIGSSLIGQVFTKDSYFHSRPSAAGNGYDAMQSGASNFGPTSPELLKAVSDRVAELRKTTPITAIPVDLVTASSSGLDPDISPAAARFQAPRVAAARHIEVAMVENLIDQNIQMPSFGFIGDKRINVLALNRALDHLAPLHTIHPVNNPSPAP